MQFHCVAPFSDKVVATVIQFRPVLTRFLWNYTVHIISCGQTPTSLWTLTMILRLGLWIPQSTPMLPYASFKVSALALSMLIANCCSTSTLTAIKMCSKLLKWRAGSCYQPPQNNMEASASPKFWTVGLCLHHIPHHYAYSQRIFSRPSHIRSQVFQSVSHWSSARQCVGSPPPLFGPYLWREHTVTQMA